MRDDDARPAGTGSADPAEPVGRFGDMLVAAVPWLIILGVIALSTGTHEDVHIAPLMAVAPAFAAITARSPRGPLIVGAVSLLAGASLTTVDEAPATERVIPLCAVALVSVAGWWAVRVRVRNERTLADVRGVAEVAQGVLLRPPAPRLGPLDIAVRYMAAASQARIGGDLYAVVPTPYGVRGLLGDVSGKGLGAVDTAATVIGAFREAVYEEAELPGVARRLAVSLERRPDAAAEEFVTCVLFTVADDGALALVNLGHPAPLLLRDGAAVPLDPPTPAPPLGVLGPELMDPPIAVARLRAGDRLLLYTDGTTEARDGDGTFYPLGERAFDDLDDLGATLDRILADVGAHTGRPLDDDAALLLLRYRPARDANPSH